MRRKRRLSINVKTILLIMSSFMVLDYLSGTENCLDANQPYDRLSGTIVTPHIKWARPYYQGEIKALVIAPLNGQRETVELAQRLSLNYTPLMTYSYTVYGYDGPHSVFAETAEGIVRKKLKESYDVIIIGKISWKIFPQEVKTWILDQVRNGTGLVYICPRDCEEMQALFDGNKTGDEEGFITNGIPFKILPVLKELKIENLLSTSLFGKGRVAKIDYGQGALQLHSLTPVNAYKDWTINYDYYHGLLAKSVIWAARKDPNVLIKEIKFADKSVEVVLLNKDVKSKDVNLELTLRDRDNDVEDNQARVIKLNTGINEMSFKIPPLKAGLHFADIWIKQDDKILNWGSVAITSAVKSRIEKLVLDRESYGQGDAIQGKVVFNEIPGKNLNLKVQLLDHFGRIMDEKPVEINGKQADFTFNIKQALSIMLRVKAELFNEEQVVCDMAREFTVKGKKIDDYYLAMWVGGCNDFVGKLMLKQYYDCGVDFNYSAETHLAPDCARANLGVIPYTTGEFFPGYGYQDAKRTKEGSKTRTPCFNDPQYRESLEKNLRRKVEALRKYVSYYSLSINGGVSNIRCVPADLCFCPVCLEQFREYLKKEYGSLDALNREWDTSYAAWPEVRAMDFEEAKTHGNYAPWVDHRLYMEAVFTDINIFAKNIIQGMTPEVAVGLDEPNETGSYSGYNWYDLMTALDFCNPYFGKWHWRDDQIELSRSFVRKTGVPTGIWFGTYCRLETFNRFIPWQSLFNGMRGVWWWVGTSDGNFIGALGPDLSPLPYFSRALEEISEIKGGIGKLLINSARETDNIAVLYSPASVHADTIQANNRVPPEERPEELIKDPVAEPDTPSLFGAAYGLYRSHQAFITVLKDIGVQFNYIAGKQLESGTLNENYKVLVLASARALSAIEVEKIKEFVRKGGVLVADYVPGTMDEHGKLLNGSPLAEVFEGFKAEGKICQYGDGKAVFLKDLLKDYMSRRADGKEMEQRKQVAEIMRLAGVSPRLKLMTAAGDELAATERVFFKNGNIEYACLLKDYYIKDPSEKKAAITFPYQAHVYDVRSGKYCGYTEKLTTKLSPGGAKIFALSPYQVNGIKLELDRETYAGGDALAYAIEVQASGKDLATHAVRLELINPRGQVVEYYAMNLLAEKGNYRDKIILARNENKGKWKVRVKEIISGKTAEKYFAVR